MEILHPTPATLHQYARGVMPDAETMRVLELHLDSCETCRQILENAPDDPFLQTLKECSRRSHVAKRHHEFIGGYQLQEELGRGGMGIVFRATQLNLGRDVALKRIAQEAISSDEMRLRFRREAELMASVKHRSVVQVLDYGEHEQTPYLVLELLSNRTLASVIRSAPLRPRLAARLISEVCRGLAAVHDVGIVHRDIKPGNILLGKPDALIHSNAKRDHTSDQDAAQQQTDIGEPRLADFGLAFSDERQLTLARTGLLIGTPCYMAPEQIRTEQGPADRRADLYSMGATLYECLTGRPPFRAPTPLETMEQACREQPAPPRRIQPGIPVDLQTICLKCLAKRPEDRYQSASALADDLERFLQGQPILAKPISVTQRVAHWSRQNPWRAALIVVAVVTLAGGVAGISWHNRQLRSALNQLESEQGETKAAQQLADANYQEARQAIRQMLDQLKNRSPADVPAVHELIERQTVEAIEFLSDLKRVQSPIAADVYVDLIDANLLHGNASYLLGKYQQAVRSFETAIEHARQLVEKYPEPENQLRLSELLIKCSLAQRGQPMADLELAEQQLTEAGQIIESLGGETSGNQEVQNEHAWLKHHLGTLRLQQQRLEEARQAFEQAVELRLALAERTGDLHFTITAVESMTNLALCYSSLGDPFKAIDWHQKIDEQYRQLVDQAQDPMSIKLSRGANQVNWCGSLLAVGDFEQCVHIATEGLEEIRPLLNAAQQHVDTRDRVYGLLGNRALALYQLGQFESSHRDWQELLPYSPDEQASRSNTIFAALTGSYAGHTDQALSLATHLAEAPDLSQTDQYNMACVYSVCAKHIAADPTVTSDSTQDKAAGIRKKAIDVLLQLEASDYFNESTIQQLEQDTDLDAIRGEPQFQSLVARLKA